MSSRHYVLICRRPLSCREGNRLYFGPDRLHLENQWFSKWLVSSPTTRSPSEPGFSSDPPAAFTPAAAQLWTPKQRKPEKLHRFYTLYFCFAVPSWKSVFFWGGLNSTLCTIETIPVTLTIPFWIRSSQSGKDFVQMLLSCLCGT